MKSLNAVPSIGIILSTAPENPATIPPIKAPIPSPIPSKIGIPSSMNRFACGKFSLIAPKVANNPPITPIIATSAMDPETAAVAPLPATLNIAVTPAIANNSIDKDTADSILGLMSK